MGKTIRVIDNGQRWKEEGNAQLKVKEAFFYMDYNMVASNEPGWIQTAFDMMMGLFFWVGLQTNVQKTIASIQSLHTADDRGWKAF